MKWWAIALLLAPLHGATAVLDCVGDAAAPRPGARWRPAQEPLLALDTPRKIVAIQFRATSLKGWRAAGAKLVLHFERGRCDGHLLAGYTARFAATSPPAAPKVEAPCTEAGAGWWQIELPAGIAQRLVDEPEGAILLAIPAAGSVKRGGGLVIHSHETISLAPRLLVEGVAR